VSLVYRHCILPCTTPTTFVTQRVCKSPQHLRWQLGKKVDSWPGMPQSCVQPACAAAGLVKYRCGMWQAPCYSCRRWTCARLRPALLGSGQECLHPVAVAQTTSWWAWTVAWLHLWAPHSAAVVAVGARHAPVYVWHHSSCRQHFWLSPATAGLSARCGGLPTGSRACACVLSAQGRAAPLVRSACVLQACPSMHALLAIP
jgi:hypothetical protein